jgi:hypothetical protein
LKFQPQKVKSWWILKKFQRRPWIKPHWPKNRRLKSWKSQRTRSRMTLWFLVIKKIILKRKQILTSRARIMGPLRQRSKSKELLWKEMRILTMICAIRLTSYLIQWRPRGRLFKFRQKTN